MLTSSYPSPDEERGLVKSWVIVLLPELLLLSPLARVVSGDSYPNFYFSLSLFGEG